MSGPQFQTTEPQAATRCIAALEAQASRHDIVHDGRSICWRRWGQGAPLVLIHGGHGSWMHWVRNIGALTRDHAVWVPDLPGFGDSEPLPGEPHDPTRQQRLVEALRSSLDQLVDAGTLIDLAGFSFGGLVAGQLAVLRGGVRRLALLGTGGHGSARRDVQAMVNWRLPDRADMLAALRHNLGAMMLHAPESIDALALAVHEHSSRATHYRSKMFSRSAALTEALDRFEQPLLMVWGEHDVTAFPERVAEALAGRHEERQWCIVPDAGHWVQYERHQEINQILARWFEPTPNA